MKRKYTINDIKSIIEHPSANHFKYLFEESPQPIAYITLDGRYLKVNRAFSKLLEYSAVELKSKTIEDITHPEDISIELEETHKLEAGETVSFFLVKKFITKTGKVINTILTRFRIDDDEGNPIHFVCYVLPLQNGTLEKIRQYIIDEVAIESRNLGLRGKIIMWIADNWKFSISIILMFATFTTYVLYTKQTLSANIEQLISVQKDLIETLNKVDLPKKE